MTRRDFGNRASPVDWADMRRPLKSNWPLPSYEPGNREESLFCSYGKFQTGLTGMKFKKQNHSDCRSFVDSCNFTTKANSHAFEVEIHTLQKL